MPAIEVITGRATNPAALTAVTANNDNTFAIRSHSVEGTAYLEEIWTQQATAGEVRITSPRLHDDVVGIRMRSHANAVRRLLPEEAKQVVYSQDDLGVEIQGGGAEVDAVALLMYYQDLGGIAARLASWEEIQPRIEALHGFPVAVAGPAVSGNWSAGTPINTTVDLMKANRDYAFLGYTVDAEVLAVAIAGTDTGNLRIGGPGPLLADETRAFFVDQGRRMGTPHIPVINSANRGGTLASVCRITAAGTVNVTFLTALLR